MHAFGVQVSKKGGATNSLELLAERLQDAISDTVSMTGLYFIYNFHCVKNL